MHLQDSPTIEKLVAVINLLKNFQHKSLEVKVRAHQGLIELHNYK